jgi:hypothetical protein
LDLEVLSGSNQAAVIRTHGIRLATKTELMNYSWRILRKGTGAKTKSPLTRMLASGLLRDRSFGGYSCLFTRAFHPASISLWEQQQSAAKEKFMLTNLLYSR